MVRTRSGRYAVKAGAILFGTAELVDLARHFYHGSLPSLFVIEPLILIELIVAIIAVIALVWMSWSRLMETVAIILGMAMVTVSGVGMVSMWSFQEYGEATIPLGNDVWIIGAIHLIGALLVLLGSMMEVGQNTTAVVPESG